MQAALYFNVNYYMEWGASDAHAAFFKRGFAWRPLTLASLAAPSPLCEYRWDERNWVAFRCITCLLLYFSLPSPCSSWPCGELSSWASTWSSLASTWFASAAARRRKRQKRKGPVLAALPGRQWSPDSSAGEFLFIRGARWGQVGLSGWGRWPLNLSAYEACRTL